MQYTEIIKLLNAGYSREEIMAMKDEPTSEETKPEETKPEEPKPEEQKPEENGMSDLVKEMRDAFSEMRKEFTAFNIMSSRQPKEKTPEDIIANIINPTRKKKGE